MSPTNMKVSEININEELFEQAILEYLLQYEDFFGCPGPETFEKVSGNNYLAKYPYFTCSKSALCKDGELNIDCCNCGQEHEITCTFLFQAIDECDDGFECHITETGINNTTEINFIYKHA